MDMDLALNSQTVRYHSNEVQYDKTAHTEQQWLIQNIYHRQYLQKISHTSSSRTTYEVSIVRILGENLPHYNGTAQHIAYLAQTTQFVVFIVGILAKLAVL